MLVGIIGAMKVEVAELVKYMKISNVETISLNDFYTGTIDSYDVVIATCGPGKVNAAICAQTMILKFSPDMVINTGVAGSLTHSLNVGDCAVASSVVQYDVDTTAIGDPLGMISGVNLIEFHCDSLVVQRLSNSLRIMNDVHYQIGLIATGDKFLNSKEEKLQILKNFDAIACEMESGSIGQVCYVNKKPFGIIRSISDNADNTSDIDYYRFLERAALRAANVVKIFLNQVHKDE